MAKVKACPLQTGQKKNVCLPPNEGLEALTLWDGGARCSAWYPLGGGDLVDTAGGFFPPQNAPNKAGKSLRHGPQSLSKVGELMYN